MGPETAGLACFEEVMGHPLEYLVCVPGNSEPVWCNENHDFLLSSILPSSLGRIPIGGKAYFNLNGAIGPGSDD